MRLLIITQKVDRKDPILGFFHRWVAEFARQCDEVTVIGQTVGEHHFSENVRVESLGKESGRPRLLQIFRCWMLIVRHRRRYDAVLVHMTPVWVVLGAPLWFVLRKPVYLWYEARGGGWPLTIAVALVRKVFSASRHGMPVATRKSAIVGHGIDTEFFSPGPGSDREEHLLITVGRITRSKHLDTIIQAFAELPKECFLMIAGGPVTGEDCEFSEALWDFILRNDLHNRVTVQCVSQDVLLPLLRRASVMIHASTTSLDKAVLEAMACECLVVSCAEAVVPILPEPCRATRDSLPGVIRRVMAMSSAERSSLAAAQRASVVAEHGLQRLVGVLVGQMAP